MKLFPGGWRIAAAAVLAGIFAGCNVGPKYVPPKVTAPTAFKEAAPAAYSSAPPGSWQPARPQDAALKGKWWEIFNEPELNSLEEQLNTNNQTIAQFFQNFMAAREQVREARASFFPTVTTAPVISRTGTGQSGVGGIASGLGSGGTGTPVSVGGTGSSGFTQFSLPIDVSWQPDLWGRVRNTVREFKSGAQVSAADLENQRLSAQANLAAFYFELRGQDSLQDLYNHTIASYRQTLELTQALLETGIDSPQDVAAAQATLASAEATAVGIATNRALFEHAIAVLVGKNASEFSMSVKPLTTPVPAIPVGLPSQLLERRPDIAGAERTMNEANAAIGIAKAAYYPTVSLSTGGGLQSSSIRTLFSIPALFWSLGTSASETIFDAGLRNATVAQFTATYNADVAAYRQTVLTAFQQVEDYLATLRITSEQIVKQQGAVEAAQNYLNLATARYQTGLDPYLNVLTAQNSLLGDQQELVALRISEMSAAVQLIQALGGGWNANQLEEAAKGNNGNKSGKGQVAKNQQ
jgi:NodT family efflux transporter outer membrane factor (OMF) lipoprotein